MSTDTIDAALVRQHRDERLIAAGGREECIGNTAAQSRGVSSAITAAGREG
jgi:hypothetical protein